MKTIQEAGYDSWQDLGNKIDWEGGIAEYFGSYSGAEPWKGTEIEEEVKNFCDALEALETKLDNFGTFDGDFEDDYDG